MNKEFIIYGLIDPRTGQLRYVGQSIRGLRRPVEHWKRRRFREAKDHCHTWVRSVLRDGLTPEIEILQECSSFSELDEAEDFWITYFRFIGCDLTNDPRAGKGTKGLAAPNKGRKLSDEHRRKISEARKGIKPWHAGLKLKEIRPERYASGPWNKGKRGIYSEETLRKIGDASSKRVPWNKKVKSDS